MAEAYFLSAEDVKLVKELLAEKRSRRGNTQGRPGAQDVDHQEHQAPEVYVAYATNGITARSGTTPGEGQVYVYQTNLSDTSTTSLEDTYLEVTVRNLSTTAVAAGEYLLVHRTKDGQWYVGGSSGAAAASSCDGCDWFAGASRYDCWTLSVVSATGIFDGVDTGQSLSFEWDATNDYWETTDDFEVCGYTGRVRLSRASSGDPLLYFVSPGYYLTMGCCDRTNQTMDFGAGNSQETTICPLDVVGSWMCPDAGTAPGGGPVNNYLRLRVTWAACSNSAWAGTGWYCVAQTSCVGERFCCYLENDPGPLVTLCSGPHATQEDCALVCEPGTGSDVSVLGCDGSASAVGDSVPAVLFITITGGTGGLSAAIGDVIEVIHQGDDGFGNPWWFGCTDSPGLGYALWAVVKVYCINPPPSTENTAVVIGCYLAGPCPPSPIFPNVIGGGVFTSNISPFYGVDPDSPILSIAYAPQCTDVAGEIFSLVITE